MYHLFYGDELARPGADLTFFEYPGAARGRAGDGMVHRILWRVGNPDAVEFWTARLRNERIAARREDGGLRFEDPEGLGHELRVSTVDDAPLVAMHPAIPIEYALQGFDGVRAYAGIRRRAAGSSTRRSGFGRMGPSGLRSGAPPGARRTRTIGRPGWGTAARAPSITWRGPRR